MGSFPETYMYIDPKLVCPSIANEIASLPNSQLLGYPEG